MSVLLFSKDNVYILLLLLLATIIILIIIYFNKKCRNNYKNLENFGDGPNPFQCSDKSLGRPIGKQTPWQQNRNDIKCCPIKVGNKSYELAKCIKTPFDKTGYWKAMDP